MANKWYLRKAIDAVKSGGYKGLKETGDIILDEAQKIVPWDTQELETSGHVTGDYHHLIVYISFEKFVDGEDIAVIQHENPTYKHKPGRTWKYLEKPFFYYGSALLPYILRDEIEKKLK